MQVTIRVPAAKTGLVIGRGGATIDQINAERGAHVELSREPPPNPTEKVLIIKGMPPQIHHAQHIIRIKVGDLYTAVPMKETVHDFRRPAVAVSPAKEKRQKRAESKEDSVQPLNGPPAKEKRLSKERPQKVCRCCFDPVPIWMTLGFSVAAAVVAGWLGFALGWYYYGCH